MALSHLGSGTEIEVLQNEKSQEAKACRRFYLPALKLTLRAFRWPFAKRFVTLGLVAEKPTSEWMYSYRYPSDCLDFRRILSGSRTDTQDTKVPYLLAGDAAGSLIFTDLIQAQCEYSALVTNTLRFPPDFDMALSYRVASLIAPRLVQGDFPKKVEALLALYQREIDIAVEGAANEEAPDIEPDSEFVRCR
jgi:hypothetical protein